jgi:hypothetical protein
MTHNPELEGSLFPFRFLKQQHFGSPTVPLLEIRATLHPGAVTDSWAMTSVLRHSKKTCLLTNEIKMLIPYAEGLTCAIAMTPFFEQLRLCMPLGKFFLPTFE